MPARALADQVSTLNYCIAQDLVNFSQLPKIPIICAKSAFLADFKNYGQYLFIRKRLL